MWMEPDISEGLNCLHLPMCHIVPNMAMEKVRREGPEILNRDRAVF